MCVYPPSDQAQHRILPNRQQRPAPHLSPFSFSSFYFVTFSLAMNQTTAVLSTRESEDQVSRVIRTASPLSFWSSARSWPYLTAKSPTSWSSSACSFATISSSARARRDCWRRYWTVASSSPCKGASEATEPTVTAACGPATSDRGEGRYPGGGVFSARRPSYVSCSIRLLLGPGSLQSPWSRVLGRFCQGHGDAHPCTPQVCTVAPLSSPPRGPRASVVNIRHVDHSNHHSRKCQTWERQLFEEDSWGRRGGEGGGRRGVVGWWCGRVALSIHTRKQHAIN